jgi:hypothetical protein
MAKKAHLKLTAAQHRHLMKALKGGALGDVHSLGDLKLFVEAGDFGGEGWWSDLGSEVKKVAKKAQQNPLVRAAEKKAVKYGATALRGATEGLVDGVGDTAATFLGMPELAVPLDAAVDRGLSSLQKAGTKYVDDKIDASGSGNSVNVRYMAPSGGGMRMANTPTHSGSGLRLSGQGHGHAHHCGCGLRLIGQGMHKSGQGLTVSPTFPAYPLERGTA